MGHRRQSAAAMAPRRGEPMPKTALRSKGQTIGMWVMTVLLLAGIGMAGVSKFLGAEMWNSRYALEWGLPLWLVPVTGAMEALGAVLLLVRKVAVYGAMLLGVTMLGAIGTLVMAGTAGDAVAPLVLLSMAAAVGWLRRVDAGL